MPECPICMELIKEPVFTPCLHSFCKECLDNWVNEKGQQKLEITCPCCRYVIEDKPKIVADSEDDIEIYDAQDTSSDEDMDSDPDAQTDWDPETESISDEDDIYDYDELY